MNNKIKLCMFGFGNAGKCFGDILLSKEDYIKQKYNKEVVVTTIVTNSRGNLYCKDGINLKEAIDMINKEGKFNENHRHYSTWTKEEILNNAEYDVLLENTPLEIFTGEPATTYIKTALGNKKHIVTANKGPIANHYRELKKLAEDNNRLIYFETTVMDGTPIFNYVDLVLKECKVLAIDGILNSTTNFILEELSKNKPYDDIIEEGKKAGFIDANPAMDIEGFDAAAKITALLNVLMDADITPKDIFVKGIEDIKYDDIMKAEKDGKVIKLICHGEIVDNEVCAFVKPKLISKYDPLATISGTSSIVKIKTDLMGEISIIEHDPEILQTGFGIYNDVIRLLDNIC